MASRINADSSNGLQLVSDSSGEIQIQSNGVTIATINSSGLSMTGGKTVSGVDSLSTATGSAPSYSARAWVNFNGTGTVAIRESGNVSSITDNGTGDYTLNFTTAMSDANYSAIGTGGDGSVSGGGVRIAGADVYTTSSFRFPVRNADNALTDPSNMNMAIFR